MNSTVSGRVAYVGNVGPVSILEPRVSLLVAGHSREFREVEAVVDTGFSGWITLPDGLIRELRLTYYGPRDNVTADGRVIQLTTYSALAQWLGHLRPIVVHQTDSERPLLGTALLENCRLTVDMRQDGLVTIQPIP